MSGIGILFNLPSDLKYLVEPALKYGRHQFDSDIFDFLDSAEEMEIDKLSRIAERVRLNSHYALVDQFLDEYPITDYEEAACLYFLLGVMDHVDLDFE